MKIILLLIAGFILLIASLKAGFFLFCLLLTACGGNNTINQLNIEKLDKTYFIGEYEVNFESEKERIILRNDDYFDYIYVSNNDTIVNVGKWFFDRERMSISLMSYPNDKRKNKVFNSQESKVNLFFNINVHILDKMGDLSILINGGEDEYRFVKIDKVKNKKYMSD